MQHRPDKLARWLLCPRVNAVLKEDNSANDERLAALNRALAVCDEGLAGNEAKPELERVASRRARLDRRVQAIQAPSFQKPYNQRPPHKTRFVRS
jgi:hypothetical protein